MDRGLKSNVAVVTAASKGIGLAVTKALVAEGARVIAGARDVGGELRSLAEGGAVDALSEHAHLNYHGMMSTYTTTEFDAGFKVFCDCRPGREQHPAT